MALLGNILWFVPGGGILLAIEWLLAALLMAITIVGIPFAVAAVRIVGFAAFSFGLAHFKLAQISFAPLGKRAVDSDAIRPAFRNP